MLKRVPKKTCPTYSLGQETNCGPPTGEDGTPQYERLHLAVLGEQLFFTPSLWLEFLCWLPNALAAKDGHDNVMVGIEKTEDHSNASPGLHEGEWAGTVGEMVSLCLCAQGG